MVRFNDCLRYVVTSFGLASVFFFGGGGQTSYHTKPPAHMAGYLGGGGGGGALQYMIQVCVCYAPV